MAEDKDIYPAYSELLKNYSLLQSAMMDKVKEMAKKLSQSNPGAFILLQFQMSKVTQVGESISNLISQVNSMINNSIRNQKSS